MQLLREYMPLEKMAALYVTGVDARWPEEALSPLKTTCRNCPASIWRMSGRRPCGPKNHANSTAT